MQASTSQLVSSRVYAPGWCAFINSFIGCLGSPDSIFGMGLGHVVRDCLWRQGRADSKCQGNQWHNLPLENMRWFLLVAAKQVWVRGAPLWLFYFGIFAFPDFFFFSTFSHFLFLVMPFLLVLFNTSPFLQLSFSLILLPPPNACNSVHISWTPGITCVCCTELLLPQWGLGIPADSRSPTCKRLEDTLSWTHSMWQALLKCFGLTISYLHKWQATFYFLCSDGHV